MSMLCLVVVCVVLVGCSSNSKVKFNPITSIVRVVTGIGK